MVAQYKSSQLRDSELPFILSPVPDPAKVFDQDTFIKKDEKGLNLAKNVPSEIRTRNSP